MQSRTVTGNDCQQYISNTIHTRLAYMAILQLATTNALMPTASNTTPQDVRLDTFINNLASNLADEMLDWSQMLPHVIILT